MRFALLVALAAGCSTDSTSPPAERPNSAEHAERPTTAERPNTAEHADSAVHIELAADVDARFTEVEVICDQGPFRERAAIKDGRATFASLPGGDCSLGLISSADRVKTTFTDGTGGLRCGGDPLECKASG